MTARLTVSLSRKVSRDFNSDCVAVGLEHEIPFSPERPSEVLEQISRSFQLLEKAIDEEFTALRGSTPAASPASAPAQVAGSPPSAEENRAPMATPSQIKFLNQLARRRNLNPTQLSTHVGAVIGAAKEVSDLTRKEISRVIDSLKVEAQSN